MCRWLLLGAVVTACSTADRQMRRAERALAIGEYAEAANYYKKAYQMTPPKDREQRGRLAFLMGECFRKYGYSARALGAYRSAERYRFVDSLTYLRLGEMAQLQGDYKQAEKAFAEFLAQRPGDADAHRGLAAAMQAPEVRAAGSLYTVRLATAFNGNRADYAPAFWGTDRDQQLYFTTTRSAATGNEISGITGQKNGDLFFVRQDEKGRWRAPEMVAGINTDYDEGTPAFSPDGRTLFLTVCTSHPTYPRMAEIWTSQRSGAAWSKPQPLKISKDTLSNYAHPAVSPDGRWLYFVSDMPGGQGGFDLWRASLHGGREVTTIENLGPSINTSGDEKFPTIRFNGELYFSSDGRGGLGGLDLFKAVEDSAQGQWIVEHLPAPINSNGDDFGMAFDGTHHRGYFSSSRATGGRGWDKLYEFSHPEQKLMVRGWVYEQDGYELPAALVSIVGSDGTNVKIPVKPDGSFDFEVKPQVNYLFMAACKGYLNFPNRLSVHAEQDELPVLQFPLASLSIPVLVRNVFYDFDQATINAASDSALVRLGQMLKENSHIAIELAAHTDSRGSDAYNDNLSQRRAESVVHYLTRLGIAPDRLTAKGYGKRQPKVVNRKLVESHPFLHEGDTLTDSLIAQLTTAQQDSCHALNRRTEFRVLRTTYGLIDKDGNLRQPASAPVSSAASALAAPSEKREDDDILLE